MKAASATTKFASGQRLFVAGQAWFVLLGAIWSCSFWWIRLGLPAMSPIDIACARHRYHER
jgi:hypothetical protein